MGVGERGLPGLRLQGRGTSAGSLSLLVPGVCIALSQAQGVGHELMMLVLIAAEPCTCTGVPGKANPHGYLPALFRQHYVTGLPPVPKLCPLSGGTSRMGRHRNAAEICAASQDQHSSQAGPPWGHWPGKWPSPGRSSGMLGAISHCLTPKQVPSPFPCCYQVLAPPCLASPFSTAFVYIIKTNLL